MRSIISKIIVWVTIALLVVGTVALSSGVMTVRIYLNPSNNTYNANTTTPGTKFNVTVWVENAPPVGAFQVYCEFNDSVINVTRWFEPKTDPQYIFAGKTTSANPVPPNPGYVHLGFNRGRVLVATNLFPTPPSQQPSSGTGKLCIFEFNITTIPTEPGTAFTSNLKIESTNTLLLDPEGTSVGGVVKQNGSYEISKPAPPSGSRIFVDPPEIIDPTMVPCVSNFDINVSLDDVANVKICEFNLTYNSNVIGFIAVNFRSINGQFPIPAMEVNDLAGYAWIKLTYGTPLTLSDPTSLVTMTFHVKNLGATPLNLTNTKILDPVGNPMPHNVFNGFFAALIRDVAVTGIALSKDWAYAGWSVNVTVTVKNNGNVSETFNVRAYYDSTLMGTLPVNDLAPNAERNIVFEWDTTGVVEGNYTIRCEADAVPFEMNTADNTLTDGKIWIMTQIHDIAVTDVSLSNSWVFYGLTVDINVTVKNLGVFNETFDVSACYNDTFVMGTVHIVNLAPSSTFEAQFTFNASSLEACHTYPISGKATLVLYEYNETDNVLVDGDLKVRFYGDLNGDGVVDVQDIYIVAAAYGSFLGHPRWNPVADLNQDSVVDLRDVYAVARNYGKGCSQ